MIDPDQFRTCFQKFMARFAEACQGAIAVDGKVVRRSNKFHAHDEKNEFSVGDVVWIEEHKPISKLKRWTVVQGEKKQKVT